MPAVENDELSLLRTLIRDYPASLQLVNARGITIAASNTFYRIFKLSPDDILGQDRYSLLETELFRQNHLAPLLDAAFEGEGGESPLVEIENDEGADPPVFLFRLKFFPVRLQAETVAGILYENVSESAALQRKLYAKNAELESFVYTVSHDLKSPLAVIEGCVDLMKDAAGDEFLTRNLQMIQRSTDRIGKLATSLLSLSRVGRETGERLDVLPTSKLVRSIMLETLEARPELKCDYSIADMPDIKLDSNSVIQLFQNLIGNAVKYRHPERKLSIEIGCRSAGKHVVYFVKDNGIGVDSGDQQKIFEVFYRGSSVQADTSIDGTGVGLAIVKKVVDTLGGRVWVDSQPGEGSTFSFSVSQKKVEKKRP